MTALLQCPARLGLAVFLIIAAATSTARTQDDIVALVDGAPITAYDIDERKELFEISSPMHTAPSRQEILDALINEKLGASTAQRLHVSPSELLKILAKSEQSWRHLQEMRRAALIEYK
jgi:hypothetical protein